MHENPLTMMSPSDNNPFTNEKESARSSSEEAQTNLRNQKIEENFRTWLARLPAEGAPENRLKEEIPNLSGDSTESADLYSFYRELCALRHEFRKSFHRSHDSSTHFSDTLEDFSRLMQQINRRLEQQTNDRSQADLESKRQLFLPLVDIYERIVRLHQHLQLAPPKKTFWQRRGQFTEIENERQTLAKGFEILEQHFLALLEKEGVQRQVCRGEIFDPTSMTAVEVVNQAEVPANTVVEELSSGYNYHNQTLKLAEVIVNRESN